MKSNAIRFRENFLVVIFSAMGTRNRFLYLDERCFFVTTTCVHWLPLIDYSDGYSLIKESLTFVNKKFTAETLAYVIMPNHLHMIILFEKDNHLSDYMRDFKKFTSTHIRRALESNGYNDLLEKLRLNHPKRAFQVWQDRFDDLYLRTPELLEVKLEYIHKNPLQEKWSLAGCPEDYPHSSASFYEKGIQGDLEVRHYKNFL